MPTGSYDAARAAIDEVAQNAQTEAEKINAYTHRVMCLMSEKGEYGQGAEMGIEILRNYGMDIPISPTKAVMAKTEMKFKVALRNRPISHLSTLPIEDDPLLALCQQIDICALYSGKLDVLKLLNWKIVQYALKKGTISTNMAPILSALALMYVRLNDVKKANEYSAAAQALNPRIRDDKSNYNQSEMCVSLAACLLQHFRIVTDSFLQCYKDFKVSCCGALLLAIHWLCQTHISIIVNCSLLERSKCHSTECMDIVSAFSRRAVSLDPSLSQS